MKPWKQELMWVQRNEQDVVINIIEKLPNGADFIPTLQPKKMNDTKVKQ